MFSDDIVLDEPTAWLLFEQARWSGAPQRCPVCDASGRCYLLQPTAGRRVTRNGRATPRRVWKCGACRRQFSVLTGTVLEGTKIPLGRWVAAIEHYVRAGTELPIAMAGAPTRRHMEHILRAGLGDQTR